jgi:hypothetical protein
MEEANRFLDAAAFVLQVNDREALYEAVQNSRMIGDAAGVVDLTIRYLALADRIVEPMVWPAGHPANSKMGE